MEMSLYEVLSIKYPTIDFNDLDQIQLVNHSLGAGDEIGYWNIPDISEPSKEDIEDYKNDHIIRKQFQIKINSVKNKEIIDQLYELDLKAIRPLMEGDTSKVEALNQQKSVLREQLLPTTIDSIISG